MAIADRVKECLDKLKADDPVNAFIQLSIAIDGTAKKEYPGKKTSVRCKEFLKKNLPFVFWAVTNGTPNKLESFKLDFSQEGRPSNYVEFVDVVYQIMRCSLLHEGEMSDKVAFTNIACIEMANGKMFFPTALIRSLLFAVIASTANVSERLPKNYTFTFGKKKVPVNELWGNLEKAKDAIRNGFLYDVEKLLDEYKSKQKS